MRARVLALAFAVASAAFVLPGPAGVVSRDGAADGADVTVVIQNNAFLPNNVTILKMSNVTWVNQDDDVHNVTPMENYGQDFEEKKILAPGALDATPLNKATQAFKKAGVYKYRCGFHPNLMFGSVVVVDAFGANVTQVAAVQGNRFDPQNVTINATTEVVWSNNAGNLHNVVFEDQSIGKVGELAAGATLTQKFNATGTFRYRCTYHSPDFDSLMIGKVVVVAGGPGGGKSPPAVRITAPANGANVNGTVNVTGDATPGAGGVNPTSVQVRFGSDLAWKAANGVAAWTFAWDTRSSADGSVAVFARALSNEFPDPAPSSITVTVNNGGGNGTGGNGTGPAPTSETKKDTPGVGPPVVALAALAAVLALRRRRA